MAPDGADAISFGTDGWRATLDDFTTPRVRMVGQAVATYLSDEDIEGSIAVGYDARDHSRGFAEELARVLAANGRDVTVAQRDCPTPVLAWTVSDGDYAGGLMVTASHNPPEYNGVKFLPADGAPALPDVTDALEARLADPDPLDAADHGSVAERDLVTPFSDHAVDFVQSDLDDLQIAYDAMHGSGRGVTDALLKRGGATVDRLRCSRDPTFGGTPPEPVPERAEELVERVTDGDAALGFVNDGDADRLGVVTPDRGFLDPNVYLAVLYDYLLDRDKDADDGTETTGDVVRTVSTSSLVDRIAAEHGHAVHETAVGFKWVADAMREFDAVCGGEESGGYGVTAHLRNKDGVLLALLTAAAHVEEPLDDRADRILGAHGDIHQDRVSVDCPDDRKAAVLSDLESDLPESVAGVAVADVNTVDGFKIALEDGTWLLVRPSGTEPKLRVYAEAGTAERADELLAAGRDLVEPLV
jgi:phosphomannomutase